MDALCCHRWYGPRKDVPDAYAWHVCAEPEHSGYSHHRCFCGAMSF
jgi:hypothetical protein